MSLRKKKRGGHKAKVIIEHTAFYSYMQRYLENRLVLGYAQASHATYENNLRLFIVWCDERGLDEPRCITKPVLERYQKYLYYLRKSTGEPLTSSAQQARLLAVKAFFKWLTQENYLLYNPASEIQLPKRARRLPHTILSVEEMRRVLNLANTQTPEGIRDRTIMELLYGCGLRRTELLHLATYDINLARQLVVVRGGKGNKDRLLPLGESAAQWIEKYMADVRPLLLPAGYEERLFLTDYGEPFTASYLGGHIKKYLQKAEIRLKGSCHLFRHAMATHMLENGADIRFIQAMLGHEDLNTTQIYTHVSVEKLREIHAATHPARVPRQARRSTTFQEATAAELLTALAVESELEQEDSAL